jgi:cytochrome c-type biogenesis protein CcmH/NrfG
MTASDILQIAVTVGVCQLICNLLANYTVYKKEPYQRALSALERFRWKRDKAKTDFEKQPKKHEKKYKLAQDDYKEAVSEVARRHTGPTMFIALFFMLLLRILGTEHQGKVRDCVVSCQRPFLLFS